MEGIIPALLDSDQTDSLKRFTLRQLLATPSAQNLSEEACRLLLSLALEWSTKETSALHRHFGDATLVKWGRLYPCVLENVFLELGPSLVPTNLHSPWSIQLFHTVLSLLRDGQRSSVSICCSVIRCALEATLKGCSTPPSLEVMAALARLVCAHLECSPRNVPPGLIVKTAVSVLARATVPKKDRLKAVANFRDNCESVAKLVASLWLSDSGSLLVCLKQIFSCLTDVSQSPSAGLSSVLSFVPVSEVAAAVEWATTVSGVSDIQLRFALCRLIEWLEWSACGLHHWIMEMMISLASTKRVATLLSVAMEKVTWLFSLLSNDACRAEVLPVVRHTLLGVQHAPVCFNKVLPLVPEVVAALKESQLSSSRQHLLSLAEVLFCLMHKFPQSADVYQSVVEALKNLYKPSKEEIEQVLQESRWLSRAARKSTTVDMSSAPKRTQPNFDLSFLPAPVLGRSKAGKAGLTNLGNTCYINCVLQALFMSDSFCADMLHPKIPLPTASKPSVFSLLQHVFAFLLATERQAYNPREFVQAARPQHFATGTQQDCAEFFRLLLDRLHEEEKATRQPKKLAPEQSKGESSMGVLIGPIREKQQETLASAAGFQMHTPAGQNSNEETLIQRHFTVGLTTTYVCNHCRTESNVKEDAFDLMLAFPEGTPGSGRILGGERKVTFSPDTSGGLCGPLPLDAVKLHTESPELASKQPGSTAMVSPAQTDQPLVLEQMLGKFLCAEQLVGDNQYMCDKCGAQQDGERTTSVTTAPLLLLVTLMRFKYDRTTHQKTKILTRVTYPEHLQLPMKCSCQDRMDVDTPECKDVKGGERESDSSYTALSQTDDDAMDVSHESDADAGVSPGDMRQPRANKGSYDDCYVNYHLSAVVVHAGSGTEAGHYFTYARHAPCSSSEGSSHDIGQWYQFNDSSVTRASIDTVLDVRRGLASNTAYVLLYARADMTQPIAAVLQPELLAMVARDNSKFQEEKLKSQLKPMAWNPSNSHGGNGSSGGGGGGSFSLGSCGGNSLAATTNRVVF